MLDNNMPWINDDDGGDDYGDYIDGFDTDGDGIVDTQGTFVDVDGDGVADFYSVVMANDINGDGSVDYFTELIDSDLDGVIDIQNDFADTNGDGIIDAFIQSMDSNHDGIIDAVYQGSDLNLDGVLDMEQFISDANEDGIPDMISQTQYIDSDGNGIVDTISFAQDQNGDGYFDVSSIAQDLNMDGLYELVINAQNTFSPDRGTPIFDSDANAASINFDPDTVDDSEVIGEPSESMDNWHLQETDSSCAVAAQEFVLEDLLDREFSEGELRNLAEQNGWYSENGTPMEDVGNILEAFGLNVEKHQGGTIQDIEHCLENGGNVIIGVDADEIWYRDNDIFGPGDDANHAVEVIGIDYNNPDGPMVILNDSGNPNGCGSMVPMDQFMDAWEDSDFFMVEAYN